MIGKMKQQMQMLWPTFKTELQNVAAILPLLLAGTSILPMLESWANSDFSLSPEVTVPSYLATVHFLDNVNQLVTWEGLIKDTFRPR